MGSFIFVILDVDLLIQNSQFISGIAQYGGAIYISGQSSVAIESSVFSANLASVDGGAIYGNGFTSLKISKNTRFFDNLASNLGDDISVQKTEKVLSLSDTAIHNPEAKTSIYAEFVTL